MSIIEIVLLAIGLSMDSLAVSVTGGAVIRNCTVCNMVKIGSFMGITQATMTVLGYLAGVGFQKYTQPSTTGSHLSCYFIWAVK